MAICIALIAAKSTESTFLIWQFDITFLNIALIACEIVTALQTLIDAWLTDRSSIIFDIAIDAETGFDSIDQFHFPFIICEIASNASGGVGAFNAGKLALVTLKNSVILIVVDPTIILTEIGCKIEVWSVSFTFPSFHVKDITSSFGEPTSISESNWFKDLYSKFPILLSKYPLIFKSTISIERFKVCDCHDEVIHEFLRQS